jgi:hypothetical protein
MAVGHEIYKYTQQYLNIILYTIQYNDVNFVDTIVATKWRFTAILP